MTRPKTATQHGQMLMTPVYLRVCPVFGQHSQIIFLTIYVHMRICMFIYLFIDLFLYVSIYLFYLFLNNTHMNSIERERGICKHTLPRISLHDITLHQTIIHCRPVHYITFHCLALQCSAYSVHIYNALHICRIPAKYFSNMRLGST